MLYIGIDVARSKHDFFIMGENGERVAGPITIRNHLDGFTRLIRTIQECKNAQEDNLGDVFIGMESTGHYGDNILNYLYEKGFTIYVMNPKLTSDIRKSTSLRKTKTDKIDCRAIANIVRTHREEFEPFTIKSYHISELKSLTRYRQNLVSDRSRLKNSVKRLINILFPEYDEIFSDTHGETSYAILTEFSGSNKIAKANIIKLTNIIAKASNNRCGRELAERVRSAARNSIGTISEVKSEELKDTIERIRQLTTKIAELDKRIEEMMKEVGSSISTIPGIGKVLSAIIISEIGNMARFKNSDKLVAYAGISPTTYQSGQYKAPIARMEKRGSRQLRYAIMQAAEHVVRYCDYFAHQMQKKRAEGKSYRVAISHVARNLLRMIYRMEITGEIYHLPVLT